MFKTVICTAFATLLPLAAMAESHSMAGDAEKGEKVFRKCQACHDVGEDAKSKVGPILNNIMGRQIASVEDFKYSKVLTEMGEAGDVWTPEALAAFLEKPRDFAKGTKMSFAGLRKEDDRADVIAFLASHSDETEEAEEGS
ncbi:c-type cytochrome [Primorskyibacter marinus]|uniref:c-type cytochrome n=1 Tax=Primorskyibacter marinus TaxID=1977320 RepID=UPI000E302879|nr:cytochrome c family protein [Primorskyibacter marinus]